MAGAAAGATSFIPDSTWRAICWIVIAVLFASVVLIELPWLNRIEVRKTSYTATPEFVYITRGLLWRRSVVVATSQVLNVEIVQGPLLRAFKLVSVRLMSIVEFERIGPLEKDAAHRLRSVILDAQRATADHRADGD